MPRIVSIEEQQNAIKLMLENQLSQYEIQRTTGLSRPFLRKLARQIGYQFPRNGIEIIGQVCMCSNCGSMFRRPPSKATKGKRQFCDDLCRIAFHKGANHPSWKVGKTATSFSNWVKNQSQYREWREKVLERDGYKCVISGRTDDLHIHHLEPKAENISPEKAFLVDNGITLNREVHEEVHKLIREGFGFYEAINELRNKYEQSK